MNSCVCHKHDSLTGGVLMAVILCCRVNIVPFPRSIPKISNVPPFISVEYSYRYSWNEDETRVTVRLKILINIQDFIQQWFKILPYLIVLGSRSKLSDQYTVTYKGQKQTEQVSKQSLNLEPFDWEANTTTVPSLHIHYRKQVSDRPRLKFSTWVSHRYW